MIDWARVAELVEEIGDDDFDEVVDLFLQEVDHSLSKLAEAAGDAGRLESLLHFLKGSALNLGFHVLARLCQHGEFAAAAGNAEAVDPDHVIETYHRSREVFLKELPSRTAA